MKLLTRMSVWALVLGCLALPAWAAPGAPRQLRCEYLENPLGIDTAIPRFGWWLPGDARDQMQSAFQVQVATAPALLKEGRPDVWDSGKVESDRNVHVEYAGPALQSFKRYYWNVRFWDNKGVPSALSDTAWFETAALHAEDFTAKWIQGEKDVLDSLGFRSKFFPDGNAPQLILFDLGESKPVAGVKMYPATFEGKAGYGFPVRYRVVLSDAKNGDGGTVVVDNTGADQANPGANPVALTFEAKPVRYVRVEISSLAKEGSDFVLALAEMEALSPEGAVIPVKDVDTQNRWERHGWSEPALTDGLKISQAGASRSPLLRKGFTLDKPVASARAYASGLGYYELYLNGARVGDHVLDPGNTVHHKRTLYSSYDVTSLLKAGENAAGLMLGHGWWKTTCAGWLMLRVEYTDGSVMTLGTDESWRSGEGPIVSESFYHGETYDARKEVDGWNKAKFDDSAWKPVQLMETPPEKLMAQIMPPVRVCDTVSPKIVRWFPDGEYVVDFGQNLTGWIRLSVQGPAGTEVTMRHAELLYPDGRINPENLRAAEATDRYILKGKGAEIYAPRFTQHGFRYAAIKGYPGKLTEDKLVAQVVHTDFKTAGHFECSDPLYNTIRDMSLWSILGNNMSMPTDCPQRDERQGWMGDAHLAAESSILNFDFAAYYENWLKVIADSQSPEGFVPDTAPHIWGEKDGSPPWAIAYPLVAWYSWRYYENKRVVEQHYDNIAKWMSTLDAKAKDGILEYCHYGDWVGVEKTPMPPIGTACYYTTACILEEFAGVLGKESDRAQWAQKKATIAAAYNPRFFNAEKNYYDEGSQFSQIIPLMLGVAGEHTGAALDRLKSEIVNTRQGHLATGILGTKYIFDVLDDSGNTDIAYSLSLKYDYPSWGYMVANNATTVWELWENKTGGEMNSHNHQMFGSILDWFHGRVAGIRKLPEAGYRHFVVSPAIDGPLSYAEADQETVRGRVGCSWSKNDKGFEMNVMVPPNTQARIVVPAGGREVKVNTSGLKPVEKNAKAEIFEAGPGSYRFVVQ